MWLRCSNQYACHLAIVIDNTTASMAAIGQVGTSVQVPTCFLTLETTLGIIALNILGHVIRVPNSDKGKIRISMPFEDAKNGTYRGFINKRTMTVWRQIGNTISVYDGKKVETIKLPNNTTLLMDVSHDGSMFVCTDNQQYYLYTVSTDKNKHTCTRRNVLQPPGSLCAANFSYDDAMLYMAYTTGVVAVDTINCKTLGHIISDITVFTVYPTAGSGIITEHVDTITLWRTDYGIPVMRLDSQGAELIMVEVDSTRQVVYGICTNGTMFKWELANDLVAWRVRDETLNETTCIRLDSRDETIYTTTYTGVLHSWDPKTGERKSSKQLTNCGICDLIIV